MLINPVDITAVPKQESIISEAVEWKNITYEAFLPPSPDALHLGGKIDSQKVTDNYCSKVVRIFYYTNPLLTFF